MTKNAFDKAKDKARGIVDESPQPDPTVGALVAQQNESVGLQVATPEAIAALLQSGQFEAAERIIEITQGMMLRGQLIGRNCDVEVLDKNTRQPKMVKSWRMRLDSGIRVSFLSSAQLERMLPEFIGRRGDTVIVKGDRVQTKKGNQMDEFLVLGPTPDAPKYPVELVEGRHVEVGK